MTEKKPWLPDARITAGIDESIEATPLPNWKTIGTFSINRDPTIPPTPKAPWEQDAVASGSSADPAPLPPPSQGTDGGKTD